MNAALVQNQLQCSEDPVGTVLITQKSQQTCRVEFGDKQWNATRDQSHVRDIDLVAFTRPRPDGGHNDIACLATSIAFTDKRRMFKWTEQRPISFGNSTVETDPQRHQPWLEMIGNLAIAHFRIVACE